MHKQKSSIMPRLKLGRRSGLSKFQCLSSKVLFRIHRFGRPARTKLSISRPFISRPAFSEALDRGTESTESDCVF